MEQIYTIPVNEAFDACAARAQTAPGARDFDGGCPFCRLHRKLENNELDLILGASMMEPDTRLKTNELGFCSEHYTLMLSRGSRLPFALMMESHLDDFYKKFKGGKIADKLAPGAEAVKSIGKLEGTCYVCERIEYNFSRMIETAALLWQHEDTFREKTATQGYFCLPHYSRFLNASKQRMDKKTYAKFYEAVSERENAYFEKLRGDVSWFCKKFDYRYADEPWYDSKDAAERTVAFLCGRPHGEE